VVVDEEDEGVAWLVAVVAVVGRWTWYGGDMHRCNIGVAVCFE